MTRIMQKNVDKRRQL